MAAAVDRFSAKYSVDPESGCWLWTAATNSDGYGSFWSGEYRYQHPKRSPIMVLAHRWAYEHFIGTINNGLSVLHECDTPACVNPAHLFLGTQSDNVIDCAQKGRRNQSRYRKLSPEIHAEIRRRYGRPGKRRGRLTAGSGGISQAALAHEYGVSQFMIGYIVRGP